MKSERTRTVRTRSPSFPKAALDRLIPAPLRSKRWKVLCGDPKHYRVGLYSPELSSLKEIGEFEKHSCDEFFILLQGSVSLALMEEIRGRRKVRIMALKPLQPVMVRTWHAGFCPNGAFTGVALVVERDQFTTWYIETGLCPVTVIKDSRP